MKSLRIVPFAALAFAACTPSVESLTLEVSNPSAADRRAEMVSTDIRPILGELKSAHCYVADAAGREIPSQVTSDSLLIFQADVAAGETSRYTVFPSDTAHTYAPVACGRIYPERADDIAWENEYGGFRVYGPATQAKGERGFGYDIFLKHYSMEPVLETLYAPEINPATFEKLDSLKLHAPEQVDEYIRSFSYHVDHGLGMDCYAVGPTLGAGVAAPLTDGELQFPWCYRSATVTDNGPLRFSVRLDFAPRAIGADSAVTEHRIITLDAGSRLNDCKVWYEGLTHEANMAMGFPRRDDAEAIIADEYIGYSDPTQGPDNGKALLGIVHPEGFDTTTEECGHILGLRAIAPADTLTYSWGFAWDREGVDYPQGWSACLERENDRRKSPMQVSIVQNR